jgi:hypothetical protein
MCTIYAQACQIRSEQTPANSPLPRDRPSSGILDPRLYTFPIQRIPIRTHAIQSPPSERGKDHLLGWDVYVLITLCPADRIG